MGTEAVWSLVVGAMVTGLLGWYIAHRYYWRQVRDARISERNLQTQFDRVSMQLRTVGIDVRSLIEAVKSGNDEAIEKATAEIADLEKRVRKTEIRSMFT